jgi:hypothetical protein
MGSPRKDRFRRGERDRVGLMAAWETSPPRPAHKFTRANDFSGLSALLRNSLRFKARELRFAQRNETFRTMGLKPLES